jgi:hypothetical protein
VIPSPHFAIFAVVMFVFCLGANAFWLVHKLFWHRHRRIFWCTVGVVVIGIGGLIITGADEIVSRVAWSLAENDKLGRQGACNTLKAFGTVLVIAPIILVLVTVWLPKLGGRSVMSYFAVLLVGVCSSLIYISPISEKLARAVFSEEALKVPSHCVIAGP